MSGIYIHGMEMPTEGSVFVIDSAGQVWSNEWPTRGYTRLDGVTAVPIPPHGRLIDADALAQQIEYERFHSTHTDGLAARHHVDEYGHFLKAISVAPTIIEAEEGET